MPASPSDPGVLLGLIADTHDVLDPRVAARFAGVDRILHAGDVCDPMLLAELEALAPVTVVAGNNDFHPGWRETVSLEAGGRRILMQHIVRPGRPDPNWHRLLQRVQPQIVVYGHTHRASREEHGGVLYLNPGSAGSPRFGLPRSVALLRLRPGSVTVAFQDLDGSPLFPGA